MVSKGEEVRCLGVQKRNNWTFWPSESKPFRCQKCLLWGGAPQSCETQADSSEAVIWASSLPQVMNPTGAKVTDECGRRKRGDLGEMKTANIEGRQTYCESILTGLLSLCNC